MNTVLVNVNQISDGALDWAAAKCQGWSDIRLAKVFLLATDSEDGSNFSTDWADGGPVIESNAINVSMRCHPDVWDAVIKPAYFTSGRPDSGVQQEVIATGRTPLEAAMRCYVISKLGPQIEVPIDLSQSCDEDSSATLSP